MSPGRWYPTDTTREVRVIAIDDSVVARRLIQKAIDTEKDLETVGVAANGRLGLEKIGRLKPDVVVLDLDMPVMDGLETLAEIRRTAPTLPVVIFSHIDITASAKTMSALSEGPTEFVQKPSSTDTRLGQDYIHTELVPVIRAIAPALTGHLRAPAMPPKKVPANRPVQFRAVVIAVSTGGPEALASLISGIKTPLAVPVLIVQHMPPVFTRMLATRLNSLTPCSVSEATQGQVVVAGNIYIAQGGLHMEVVRSGDDVVINLHDGPKENFCRPSADVLFRSAENVYGAGVMGVVLTGMGEDGRRGSEAIVAAGGVVIAQTPATAVVASMPNSVTSIASAILPVEAIADEIRFRVEASRAR